MWLADSIPCSLIWTYSEFYHPLSRVQYALRNLCQHESGIGICTKITFLADHVFTSANATFNDFTGTPF